MITQTVSPSDSENQLLKDLMGLTTEYCFCKGIIISGNTGTLLFGEYNNPWLFISSDTPVMYLPVSNISDVSVRAYIADSSLDISIIPNYD